MGVFNRFPDWFPLKKAAELIGIDRDTLRRRAVTELEGKNRNYRRFGDGPTSPIGVHKDEVARLVDAYSGGLAGVS